MRLYHYLRADHALDDITRGGLKIARLDDLNDPFELLAAELSDKDTRRAFTEMRAEVARTRGVLCFSRRWRNPLMWSHYADRHRGVCLGFDVPAGKSAPISYDAKRLPDILPRLLTGSAESQEQTMLKLLTTKFRDWQYEDEVRVFPALDTVDPVNGLYFADFGHDLVLKTVILGSRFVGQAVDFVNACRPKYTGVKIFVSRLAFRTFQIVERRGSAIVV